MNSFEAVQAVIKEELPQMGPLPSLLEPTVDLFRKAHIYYRSFKLGTAFRKADESKGNPVAYGAALHLAADYTSLSYALNVALVAKCAEDLLREYRNISESNQSLWNEIKCQYPIYHPVEWNEEEKEGMTILSPSSYLYQQIQMLQFIAQIQKVTHCSIKLIWQTFKLSMSLSDAYLIMNGDQGARFEGFTELVSEWEGYQSQLEEDKQRIIEAVENGSGLADRILKHLEVPETCASIIKQLKKQKGKSSENTECFIDDLYEVAEDALDPIYIKGKIVPMHADFSEGKAAPPALPYGQFPPWGGQKVEGAASKKEQPVDWFAHAKTTLLKNPALTTGISVGLLFLTDTVKGVFAKKNDKVPPVNPFA